MVKNKNKVPKRKKERIIINSALKGEKEKQRKTYRVKKKQSEKRERKANRM